MMQLLLHQINCPPFWTWRVSGLDRVLDQSFFFSREFLLFFIRCVRNSRKRSVSGYFLMALLLFLWRGSVTSWAVQETGMLPLLSCDSSMTAWLKPKQKGSSMSGEEEEDLVMPKLQVIQKISQGSYTRTNVKWLLSLFTGLFCLKRDDDTQFTILSSQIVCLWLIDSHVFFLGSHEEHERFNKFVKKKDKYDKNNLQAVFCLLELLVYIQLVTWPPLSCNAQFSYWFHYLPFSSKIFENMLHLSFSMKLTFSAIKCH